MCSCLKIGMSRITVSTMTRDLPWVGTDRRVYTGISLRGLDALRYVRSYFEKRTIDMPSCARADSLVSNPDGATGARSPQLMASGTRRLLVCHPNAIADGMRARSDPHRPARLRIDLRRFAGSYSVEWYRPADGVSRAGATVTGGGVDRPSGAVGGRRRGRPHVPRVGATKVVHALTGPAGAAFRPSISLGARPA
jgi:hypothetical protein